MSTRSKAVVTGRMHFHVEWSETLGTANWNGTGVTEKVYPDNGTVQKVKCSVPAGSLDWSFLRVWTGLGSH